ncbi:MAG: GNAT family N-acetyltransferase [Pseudomonadota bacterium]
MLWRQTKREMDAGMGEGNRLAMKALFDAGHVPGLVAYHGSEAIGWIQVDRRSAFLRLETSRTLQPVYAAEVWSVSCFLIDKRYRLRVLSSRLLRGACAFAKGNGATVLEGYPIDTPKEKYPPVYAWTGFVGAFREAGFQEVVRRTPTRPIMRKTL